MDSTGLSSDLRLIFKRLAFVRRLRDPEHPVCTADTSLINQWDVIITVRISSSSVLQTQLSDEKLKFYIHLYVEHQGKNTSTHTD